MLCADAEKSSHDRSWISPRLSSTVWTKASGFYRANNDKDARITVRSES